MGTAGALRSTDAHGREPSAPSRWRRIGPLVLVVVVVVTATAVFLTGGGTLTVEDAAEFGIGVHPTGTQVNFAAKLVSVSARSVVLDHVSSAQSDDLDVRFAVIYTYDENQGFLYNTGSIASYDPVPVRGARIGDGSRGDAYLVVSVVPRRPGPWRLTRLTVAYHSWLRHRSTSETDRRGILQATAT